MNILKAHYKFGNEEITPKDIILIIVSSVVAALTSVVLVGGTQKLGFSLLNIALLILAIIVLMPIVIFYLIMAIYHLVYKD